MGGGYPFPNLKAKEFAEKFAAFHGASFGVCVANGTVALEVALKVGGVKAGDEVIVPVYTWEGTAHAVLFANAIPVFVDIDPDTYCIDPRKIEEAINDLPAGRRGKTRAIIPVHLAMNMADMDAIMAIAERHNLLVIEDCAHAHGGRWRGRGAGSIGHLGCFSFQTSKLMTAGEGGIILTSNGEIEELCESLVNCGRARATDKYKHRIIGHNYRMTEFQAAILLQQLARLDTQTRIRADKAAYLTMQLKEIEGLRPLDFDMRITKQAIYYYVFRYDEEVFKGVPRNSFVAALEAEGVPCDGLFYEPVYRSPLFHVNAQDFPLMKNTDAPTRFPCPRAEHAAYHEAVRLPHWLLLGTRADVDDIVSAIMKIKENIDELIGYSDKRIEAKRRSRAERNI